MALTLIDVMKNNKRNSDEIELCAACGKKTEYKRSVPIDQRLYYVEGAGQLCRTCYLTLTLEDM